MLKNRSLLGIVGLQRVDLLKNLLIVSGTYGSLEKSFILQDSFYKKKNKLVIFSKQSYGLLGGLFNSILLGVSMRFFIVLTLEGLGYIIYFCKEGPLIRVGLTHYLCYQLDKKVSFFGFKNKLILYSIDKELLGKVGFLIFKKKRWDSYKGKGFKFLNEKIILKIGKKR